MFFLLLVLLFMLFLEGVWLQEEASFNKEKQAGVFFPFSLCCCIWSSCCSWYSCCSCRGCGCQSIHLTCDLIAKPLCKSIASTLSDQQPPACEQPTGTKNTRGLPNSTGNEKHPSGTEKRLRAHKTPFQERLTPIAGTKNTKLCGNKNHPSGKKKHPGNKKHHSGNKKPAALCHWFFLLLYPYHPYISIYHIFIFYMYLPTFSCFVWFSCR